VIKKLLSWPGFEPTTLGLGSQLAPLSPFHEMMVLTVITKILDLTILKIEIEIQYLFF